MVVALYARKILEREYDFFRRLFTMVNKLEWTLIIEKDFYEQLKSQIQLEKAYSTFESHHDLLHKKPDLAISIGGDGTFLKCVSFVRSSKIPIVGINTGRLGFLADVKTDRLEQTLQNIENKKYTIEERSLLTVNTDEDIFGKDNYAFNEIVMQRRDTSSMITVEAYVENHYINSYWADGLLVGTPSGSTAYNLSCGGPIITPGSNVHFITPISAHNLNVCPLILSADAEIRLKGVSRDKEILVSLDSFTKKVKNNTEIRIKKADFTIHLIKFEGSDFFKTIREKMMWGIDQRNRF